jgi:hypothetical protein
MSLTWEVRLWQSVADMSIPVTILRSPNRSSDGNLETLNPENIFIDLGAHHGESLVGFAYMQSRIGSSLKYHVTSLEASRQSQIWAPLALSANQVSEYYGSIYVASFAADIHSGVARFRDDGSAGSTLHPEKPLNASEEIVQTPTLGIDKILSGLGCNHKSVILKLNIEGAEYAILDFLCSNPQYLSSVTEVWVDFHGETFENKSLYLEKELNYISYFEKSSIGIHDIDFMTGFYKGFDKHPPERIPWTKQRAIDRYLNIV